MKNRTREVPKGKDYCIWSQEGKYDFQDTYNTSCGKSFCFNDGTAKQNGIKYCCFCGKVMKQELARI